MTVPRNKFRNGWRKTRKGEIDIGLRKERSTWKKKSDGAKA